MLKACIDAGWAGVMYLKVQQYNDAHGLQSGSSYYYVSASLRIETITRLRLKYLPQDKAVDIQKGMADTWLSDIGCGGGGMSESVFGSHTSVLKNMLS